MSHKRHRVEESEVQGLKYFGEFARVNFPREWPPERPTRVREEYLQAAAQ
jgi:hypothetical protein